MPALRSLARPFLSLASHLYKKPRLRHYIVEIVEEFDCRVPVANGQDGSILMTVASRMEHQRALGFLSKEPDTIAWLDQLQPGEVFLDIGANVGVYSLYAALSRGARVIALEPESQNFAALNRNINANGVDGLVTAYPIAASDALAPTLLHLSAFATGQSNHNAHEPISERGTAYIPPHRQGTIAMTVDTLLSGIADQVPRFVKIDVDGNEARVLTGMRRLLGNPKLEQVLIETGTRDQAILDVMSEAGFTSTEPSHLYRGRGNRIFCRDTGSA